MTGSFPTPPIHDADQVPFHQLDPLRFERLLVDLLQEEDGVVLAEQHGISGQADFGVDAIGLYADGTCDLISCKRYQDIRPRDLAVWSEDMLAHWSSRWSRYRIRRFILATSATNIANMQIVSQIPAEMERFRVLGIHYELWGPTKLRTKLVPHRRLAAAYLKEHWADAICGAAAVPTARIANGNSMIEAGVLAQMAELQNLLSGEVAARVEDALELLRQGRGDPVRTLAEEMHKEPRWGQLTPEAQAQVLRLEASAALSDGDVSKAEALSAAADACHAPDEPRLAARIAAERHGAEAGLTLLGRPASLAGRQLRSAMLLTAGHHSDARDELLSLQIDHPADPETLRLLALERLGAGRRDEALALIIDAEASAGNWLATRRSGAMIRYSAALSPSLGTEWTLVPNPIDADLVRRDPEASTMLAKALELIDGIPVDLRSVDDDLWRLAILANVEGRRSDAVDLAKELLGREPADAMVVGWSLMRDFEVDIQASRSALEHAYTQGAATPQVRVLGMLLAAAGSHDDAATFLEEYLDSQGDEQRAEAMVWIARFRGTGMDRNSEILYNAQRHGDWEPAEALLDELLSVDPPQPFGLTIAELAASANRWKVLIRNIDRLIAYRSAAGVRIAVVAAMNAHRFHQAIQLLQQHGPSLGPELPADMRRLRAEAWARSGRFDAAIREATILASQGRLDDALFEAELRARIGSVQQALPVVRRALNEGRLDAIGALQWSQRVRQVDPLLAKELVRKAVSTGVDDAHVLAAWNEAIELGLDAESSQLMPRVAAKAERGDPSIMTLSVDKAQQFIRDLMADEEHVRELYMSGAIPVHLYARGRADVLLRVHRLNLEPEGGSSRVLQPRLLRHGGRPLDHEISSPYRSWRIHMDVTGLLEAQRAELLERLEAHPNGIVVSAQLPSILHEMQLSAPKGRARREAHDRLMRLVNGGIVEVQEWLAQDVIRIGMEDEEASDRPLRDLLSALSRSGVLSSEEAMSLADTAELSAVPDLDLGSPFSLSDRVTMALAGSAMLERIARSVRLICEAGTIERIRAGLSDLENEERASAAAASLAQRVGDGIAAGVYRLLPAGTYDEDSKSSVERELIDLLSLPDVEHAVVWMEDRNLTGYVTSGSVPIVSMIEVAGAMLASDDLSLREHAEILRSFRASGASLLPFRIEEVVEPLLAAPIVGEYLVETQELADVRRAFAATRTLEGHLKIGSVEGPLKDRPDEDLVARSTMRIFSEALQLIWSDATRSIADCLARSDWLLDALRIRRLFRVPETGEAEANRFLLEAMQIGHCFDKAVDIGGLRDERAQHRINYLNWCWQRLIVPRAGVRPSIVDAVGDYLARFYRSLMEGFLFEHRIDRASYDRLMFLRVQRMPEPIAERVRAAGIFPNQVRLTTSVMLRSQRVESGRFWRAMRRAARYGRASLRTAGGKRLLLRRITDGVVISGAVKLTVGSDIALVLAARPSEKHAAVTKYLERLDLHPDDARLFADEIIGQQDLARTASCLQKAETLSVIEKQHEVERSLHQRRGVGLVDLEPASPERLAWHHRLDMEGDSKGVTAWPLLSSAVGIVEAFIRSAALPSSLPSADTLTRSQVEEIAAAARTPMALAAAGRLLREADAGPTETISLVWRFVEAVENWGPMLLEVLNWTIARTKADNVWKGVDHPTRLRLCWLHSDWLVRVFERHGFDPEALAGSFPVHGERMDAIDRLSWSPGAPADQADPSTITPAVLMMHGLAAILGDLKPENLLPDDLLARIKAFVPRDGASGAVDPSLLLRRPEQNDALGGFLLAMPDGLLGTANPSVVRDDILDRAIRRLREDAADQEAWLGLIAFSTHGLDSERAAALAELTDVVDLFAAADLEGKNSQPYVWRGVLGPLAWSGRPIDVRLAALSARCARTFGGSIRSDTPAEIALNELIGCALNGARTGSGTLDHDAACRYLWAVATAWPASVPLMRRMVSRVLDGAAPVANDAFWRLGNDLNRLP